MTTPLSGWFAIGTVRHAMDNLTTKLEIPTFIHYQDKIWKALQKRIFNVDINANLPTSLSAKELRKLVSICRSYWQKCGYPFFGTSVYVNVAFTTMRHLYNVGHVHQVTEIWPCCRTSSKVDLMLWTVDILQPEYSTVRLRSGQVQV